MAPCPPLKSLWAAAAGCNSRGSETDGRRPVRMAPCLLFKSLWAAAAGCNSSGPKTRVGGARALAHSIRRCRASRVAKASLLPGVLPVPPTPPSRCFLKATLKKRRSRLHFGAFLHLEDFQFGEKCFFSKILHIAGVLAFFADLGGIKKSSKKQVNSQKNHGSRKALFRNGFWSIFGSFFYNFQGAKHW